MVLLEFLMIHILLSMTLQGEQYKLIWPEQQEFVRMAARFGATIVPFGTVGEDDIAEVSFLSQKNFPKNLNFVCSVIENSHL